MPLQTWRRVSGSGHLFGEVVENFHARWNGFGRNGAASMPACMGYLLDADENPFANRAVDVLK